MTTSRIYPADCDARDHVFESFSAVLLPGEQTTAEPATTRNTLDKAREEAFEKGVIAGTETAQQELTRVAEVLVAAAGELKIEYGNTCDRLKRQMLELSMAIARQVVMCELQTQPEVIGEIVNQILDNTENRKAIALRVHPDDAKRMAQLPAGHTLEQAEITIREDDAITPGGCIMETGFGKLDARVETRLTEIAASLLGTEQHTDNQIEAPEATLAPEAETTEKTS